MVGRNSAFRVSPDVRLCVIGVNDHGGCHDAQLRMGWLLSARTREFGARYVVTGDVCCMRHEGATMPAVAEHLTSTANPRVKSLKRLGAAAERRAQGRFVVEGRRAISDLLACGWQVDDLLLRDDLDLPAEWDGHPLTRVSSAVAERISQQRTASGYLAVFSIPETPVLDPALGGLVAVGVADPGNLGTLLRSAAAFGIRQVRLLGGADPYAPKVVQAATGGLARLAIDASEGDPALVLGALAAVRPVCALVASGGGPQALPPPPAWLVVGSEAHGLSADAVAACSHHLTLPMPGGVESLNAGVAGAIACFLVQGLHRGGEPEL